MTEQKRESVTVYDPHELVRFIDAVSAIGRDHGWVYRRAVKDNARIRIGDKKSYFLTRAYIDKLKAEAQTTSPQSEVTVAS